MGNSLMIFLNLIGLKRILWQ